MEVQPKGTAASGPSCQLGDGTAEQKASDQYLNAEFTRISHMRHLCPQSRTGETHARGSQSAQKPSCAPEGGAPGQAPDPQLLRAPATWCGGESPPTGDGGPSCRGGCSGGPPSRPGSPGHNSPRPISRAHCRLCSPDGDADTSAPPNGPRPLLAQDQLRLRGSGATTTTLLLLNHPPLLIGSGRSGPVPVPPATRAPHWDGRRGPWLPRAHGCQSQASTRPDVLFRGRKALPPTAVPGEAPAVARPGIWPWSPRPLEGELWHRADERGQGRQGVKPWEPAQSPPGQRRGPTPGRGAAGAPRRERKRPLHTEG